MTIDAHYFSPTTPGAASFDVDVSSAIRLGSITGLAGEARLGATGSGNIVLDDPGSTIGYLGDGIVGLKQFYINETACPAGNQRLWTGYIYDRRYRRRPGSSLILGADREIDVTLVDINDFLSFRVFAPVADDPTSSFVRPAETHLQRIQALLTDVDFISTTLADIGYIPVTGGVEMDAKDYTKMRPVDVLNDCAQAALWNFFVLFDEATNQFVLWFDDWQTDGSSTVPYDSPLRLTNVNSERDSVTFPIAPDATETLDPSRLVTAAYGEGDGVTTYRTNPTTANTFAWRDMVAPAFFVKTLGKLNTLVDAYLAENATEAATITCTVQIPAALVTSIHEGMRIQVHFSHLPLVNDGFTWTRILSRTIRQDQETEEFYWLDLELSPMPPGEPQLVAFLAGSMNANPTESLLSSGPAWAGATAYSVGDIVGGMRPGHTYECTVAGTSGGSGPTWPNGGTVTDGTVTWTDLGAIWTQRYWSDDISNVAQFPGPGDQQWMGIYTRPIRDLGETVNVLTVERAPTSTGFTGAWVYEVDGLDWTAVAVIAGNDTVLPDTAAGNITPTNPATDVNISTVAFTNSVLFGGMSMQKVNYGEGTVFTATDGTELINANTKNLVIACSVHDGTPPWSWAGYATGTGTLTIGGTITSSGANGCSNGYNLMGRGYAAVLVRIAAGESFSIVQSAHNSSDPIQYVVFASPPTP